jgi:hypothetical protein
MVGCAAVVSFSSHNTSKGANRARSSYYGAITTKMAAEIQPKEGHFDYGDITLTRNGTSDMTSLDFFDVVYGFHTSSGTLIYPGTWEAQPLLSWNASQNLPRLSMQSDGFGKALYSTVLADLGQVAGPNALADKVVLQHLLSQNREDLDGGSVGLDVHGVPVMSNESYNAFKDKVGPLGIDPATIYTQYSCAVPQRKDIGALIIAIVIADLVFLQALWTVLNWAATKLVSFQYPHWNYCPGCSGQDGRHRGSEELVSLHDTKITSTKSSRDGQNRLRHFYRLIQLLLRYPKDQLSGPITAALIHRTTFLLSVWGNSPWHQKEN